MIAGFRDWYWLAHDESPALGLLPVDLWLALCCREVARREIELAQGRGCLADVHHWLEVYNLLEVDELHARRRLDLALMGEGQ